MLRQSLSLGRAQGERRERTEPTEIPVRLEVLEFRAVLANPVLLGLLERLARMASMDLQALTVLPALPVRRTRS